jgi:hypothetical protein
MQLPRFTRVSHLATAGLLLLAASCACAQSTYLLPIETVPALPTGVRISSASMYVAGLDVPTPAPAGALSTSSSLFVEAGWATGFSWLHTGRRTAVFADYDVAYNQNWWQGSGFKGFDHIVSFSIRTSPDRRLNFSFDGRAESITFAGLSARPSDNLSLAANSADFGALAGGVSGAVPPTTDSPLTIALYGVRRQDAAAQVAINYFQSPRLIWRITSRVTRELPVDSRDPLSQGSIVYPGATTGMGTVGFAYMLSRRTSLSVDGSYLRAYSTYSHVQVTSGAVGIRHLLSREWFVRAEAGFGYLSEVRSTAASPASYGYRGAFGLGTKLGSHSLVASVRRDIGDTLGFGSRSTTGAGLGWSWRRGSSPWSLQAGASYERLAGRLVDVISGWVSQASISRRLTSQTTLSVQAFYASDTGSATGGFIDLARRGIRMTFTWAPPAHP